MLYYMCVSSNLQQNLAKTALSVSSSSFMVGMSFGADESGLCVQQREIMCIADEGDTEEEEEDPNYNSFNMINVR